MPNWLRILLMAFLIGINYIASYYVRRSVTKIYGITKSPEKAMNKLRIYNQYILTALYIVTIIPFSILAAEYVPASGTIRRVILIGFVPFSFLMVVAAGQLLIIDGTYKMIRGTTESIKEQMKNLALTALMVLVPPVSISFVLQLIPKLTFRNTLFRSFAPIFPVIILIIAFNIGISLLYPRLLKAVDLEDDELILTLNKLFDRSGVKRVKIYQYPTKAKKIANALVVGFLRPKVFISDYYLENAPPEEIEAIIAHEIGHLKYHHTIKRLAYILAGSCSVWLAGVVMEWYENFAGREIHPVLGLSILLIPFILYMSVGLLLFFRHQERKADAFALQVDIKPEIMIAALLKLAKLNHMVTGMKKVDEKFQTHPTIAKRIRQIEKLSGYQYDIMDE